MSTFDTINEIVEDLEYSKKKFKKFYELKEKYDNSYLDDLLFELREKIYAKSDHNIKPLSIDDTITLVMLEDCLHFVNHVSHIIDLYESNALSKFRKTFNEKTDRDIKIKEFHGIEHYDQFNAETILTRDAYCVYIYICVCDCCGEEFSREECMDKLFLEDHRFDFAIMELIHNKYLKKNEDGTFNASSRPIRD